jgi:hypothetical protein
MTREMVKIGGAWRPDAYVADTSVKRIWNGIDDPTSDGSVQLAPGDEWRQSPAPIAPPPPDGYTPRIVPPYGTYDADDTNTGIVPGSWTRPRYNYPGTSPIVITQDGTTLTSLDVYGDIIIQAKNVVIQDCITRGPRNWPTNDGAVIDCNNNACVNLLVRDCTYVPQLPNYYRNFIIGHEYTVERCRSIWANDHFGIYSKLGTNLATNARVFGCYATDNVYWHGTASAYPGQPVGSITVTTTWGDSYTVAGYPIKTDGTHNDGCQIQGGLGGSRSIWVKGNHLRTNDAWAEVNLRGQGHPLGWSDPIPMLGTGDSPKLRTYSSGASLNPLPDGRYSNNGQCIIVQQNTYQFPQIDTCVVEDNLLDDGGQGITITAHGGGYTTIQCTVQNNRLGGDWYNYASPGTPSIYPVRIDFRADATVAGIATQSWSAGPYGTAGTALTEGRTSGIRYDN